MKALCIGHTSYEISTILNGYPVENNTYNVSDKIESGGGEASNIACTLGKWGIETYLSTAIGSDSYADKIKKEFEISGVKLDFVESNFDKDTALDFVLINKENGSRTVFGMTSQERVPHVKKTELDIEPSIIIMDGYEYQVSSRTLNRFPNVKSIMDASSLTSEVVELAKYCTYVIATLDFAEKLTNIKTDFNNSVTLLNLYNEFKSRYPRNEVIIKLGEKGVLYANNGEIKVMPSLKTEIKDVSGTDSVFVGAFAYGIINELEIEKTITYAIIASSLSSLNYGGRLTIPTLNNVITYYNQKFGSNQDVQNQG